MTRQLIINHYYSPSQPNSLDCKRKLHKDDHQSNIQLSGLDNTMNPHRVTLFTQYNKLKHNSNFDSLSTGHCKCTSLGLFCFLSLTYVSLNVSQSCSNFALESLQQCSAAVVGGTHSHDTAGCVYHGSGTETMGVGEALCLRKAVV